MLKPIKYGGPEMALVWRLVPEWANWMIACHEEGRVLVSAKKPRFVNGGHVPTDGKAVSLYLNIDHDGIDPAESVLERPFIWKAPDENTPVDTVVWVRQNPLYGWVRRNYAGKNRQFYLVWKDGGVSATTCFAERFGMAVIANKCNLLQRPPLSLIPRMKAPFSGESV